MYALENKDVLKSNKNKTPEAEINPFIWDTPNYFEKSMRLCYIFNKSEERARLNAVYEHVKSEDEDIDSLNNITLLSEMKKYINMLRTIYVSNYSLNVRELFPIFRNKSNTKNTYKICKTSFA